MTGVRWGVLSTADIGMAKVIPAIQQAENCDVVAIASRSSDRAEAAAAQLGIPAAYASYEALLKAPDIDAVYLPLPNNLHREWTIKAADMGCETSMNSLGVMSDEEGKASVARKWFEKCAGDCRLFE